MTYEKYLDYSREELLEKVRAVMSPKRFNHVLGVERAAIALAEKYGYDTEKAGLAGLLHDYAKELPDQEFLELIDKYELDPALKQWGNNVWHGIVGSHEMSTLDKIVYVADYIEHNRNFPLVEEARQVAEQSLDKAVAFETVHTVEHLAHQALPIFPQTLETYNAFVHYLKD